MKNRFRTAFTIVIAKMNNTNSILLFLASTSVDVVMNQELMYGDEQFWNAKRKLLNGKYKHKGE